MGSTFEEIAAQSRQHGIDMAQRNDPDHLEAMNAMRSLMQQPGAMESWMEEKRQAFDALPDS